jgi:hypothetical protein
MNKNSSRSHAILQVFVEQRWLEGDEEEEEVRKRRVKRGLLTIVDLAGSERLSKSGSEGARLSEAKNINKSIAALGNCISALAANGSGSHVPFRDSKLTRLLTDSLGGNSKTCIYACVGPSLANYDETYSTLLFATRAMKIRTFVRLNDKVDYRMGTWNEPGLVERNALLETEISTIRQEAESLRSQLAQRSPSPSPAVSQVLDPSQNLSTITGFSQELGEEKAEARERELVSKFSHIIQHLQAELARKNVELELLKIGRLSPIQDPGETTLPVRSHRWRNTSRR